MSSTGGTGGGGGVTRQPARGARGGDGRADVDWTEWSGRETGGQVSHRPALLGSAEATLSALIVKGREEASSGSYYLSLLPRKVTPVSR